MGERDENIKKFLVMTGRISACNMMIEHLKARIERYQDFLDELKMQLTDSQTQQHVTSREYGATKQGGDHVTD